MATRKTYNSIDTINSLILVERSNGGLGGYDIELLVDSLSPLEVQLLVCTKCSGIMNEACQVGEEQLHMCQMCIGEGEDFQPMKLSRNSIPNLISKCPLFTRGCLWSGPLNEVSNHLEICPEFVISCPNDCQFIFKRSESLTHAHECHLSKVKCEYCNSQILNSELETHKEVCLDFEIECPNECSSQMKRLALQEHLSNDCPNTLVSCPLDTFGCNERFKRCELELHQEKFESKHTQLQLSFALKKISSLEEDKKQSEKQYSGEVAELKLRLDSQEDIIISLEQEKTFRLKEQTHRMGSVDSLSSSGENIYQKHLSSPSLFTSSQEETGDQDVVIRNIGSTVEYRNVISKNEKVVIHFFDNSSVSHSINSKYKKTAVNFPTIKFCQANISNDRGMPKVTGVKLAHELQLYNQGVKVNALRWKDEESTIEALSHLHAL